jgi:SPP1 family predicted phage head-tail adaptor
MVMPAGRRRHEAILQNPGTAAADGDGGFTQTYADLSPRTLWVGIEPATALKLERLAAGSSIASATHIVTGAYHAGVTTKTRLTVGARTFYVIGVVNPEERNRELVMVCTEVVS